MTWPKWLSKKPRRRYEIPLHRYEVLRVEEFQVALPTAPFRPLYPETRIYKRCVDCGDLRLDSGREGAWSSEECQAMLDTERLRRLDANTRDRVYEYVPCRIYSIRVSQR